MTEDDSTLADVLARALKGRSRRWLARQIGVSDTAIRSYERGEVALPGYRAEALGQVLGVDFQWLLELSDRAVRGNQAKREAASRSRASGDELEEVARLLDEARAALAAYRARTTPRRPAQVDTTLMAAREGTPEFLARRREDAAAWVDTPGPEDGA